MLNAHQLNVFVIAAETLNFTQTAKKLHLTQSSVSQHIKSLESQVEVALFTRRGRTIELTEAGQILLPMARDIVSDSMRAMETMTLLQREVHGHLIIGCNTAPGKYLLPLIITLFHKELPRVRFTCQVLPQSQAMERLAKGSIHFALMNIEDKSRSSAEAFRFMKEPISLILPKDHPWTARSHIEPDELLEEKFILRESESGTYHNTKAGLAAVGVTIEQLDTLLVMGNSEAIALAVEQGLGVGFISQLILERICHDRVATVQVRGLEIYQDIYFCRQTRLPASNAQVAFWQFIEGLDVDQLLEDFNCLNGKGKGD